MFAYEGKQRRCVAMPLGGVGTGNLAICGDGSLRQWQIHNKVNHVGYLPHSFFAIRWMEDHRPVAKLLQTDEFWDDFEASPTISDHYVPSGLLQTLGSMPTIGSTRFRGCYPVAELEYDTGCPDLEVSCRAWNPLVRGDTEDSSWPVAIFEFKIRNNGSEARHVSLLSSLQNAVGWDGASLIHGVENLGYGSNRNVVRQLRDGVVAVEMTQARSEPDHPSFGSMMLLGMGEGLTVKPEWSDLDQLWNTWTSAGRFKQPDEGHGPSPEEKTWNAAVTAAWHLKPGEERTATFIFAWYFPNRYVDWAQWDEIIPAHKSRFFLGNHYCNRGEPISWIAGFIDRLDDLRAKTEEYVGGYDSSPVSSAVSACVANLRTNICIRTEDGRFYGFEGGHGASTWEGLHAVGGCCPMNCTHVWNYEQGLFELWPDLFQSMRDTDWKLNLSPKGQLPHRVTLPVYVRKLWDVGIGGPHNPALDGVFAAVLKSYQYGRGNGEWLASVFPEMGRAMDWVMSHADDRQDGVLRGEQPNTYDIHLYGPNTFVGSQYLAALLAMEASAKLLGESGEKYRERFESGSRLYDELCWNGEFYVQRIPDDCDKPYQFGTGCASDQLLGQWWAHHLDLGYVLPKEHVRAACLAIFQRNFRRNFVGFKQDPRVFASDQDSGLLVCTYEEGERPAVPLLYSDEVWTGIEYAFAALCHYEGISEAADEVVRSVRNRYDGRERNPYNEVECGDHYIRALSAWSLPKSMSGVRTA